MALGAPFRRSAKAYYADKAISLREGIRDGQDANTPFFLNPVTIGPGDQKNEDLSARRCHPPGPGA